MRGVSEIVTVVTLMLIVTILGVIIVSTFINYLGSIEEPRPKCRFTITDVLVNLTSERIVESMKILIYNDGEVPCRFISTVLILDTSSDNVTEILSDDNTSLQFPDKLQPHELSIINVTISTASVQLSLPFRVRVVSFDGFYNDYVVIG
ncbi:MAG: hypothetical protein B6V02_00545 [Thermoprotei archaeon ex4572_64]|nr:MAG: hypothetical protein B6V02_00545 [Thermoprotei archaeon ex4572_64]